MQSLFSLSVDKILDQPDPGPLVRQLAQEDFFWLVKKAGEDEGLQLLRMASSEQKQYLLDVETWRKDRLDLERASTWLSRMLKADSQSLAEWLFSSGESLAYYYLFKKIQVEIRNEDDDHRDFGEDFFTLDNIFYVRVSEEEDKTTIKNILSAMADKHIAQYQTLLSTLAGVIPAELEENMYRLRNVRLAEHGFLPPDEALAVYAPLEPDALEMEILEADTSRPEEDGYGLIPISPLSHIRQENFLTKVLSEIEALAFQDRIRLEFAGLCNQILSADGLAANDPDTLIRVCQRAAGHLILALEKMCGTDQRQAEILLRNNALVSLFRVGFGLVLKLRWEAEQWITRSWFNAQGLGLDFWADDWEKSLAGILKKRPQRYVGQEEGTEFRDFEGLTELKNSFALVRRLEVLDRLMGRLARSYPMETARGQVPPLTFHQMLFNFWARRLLELKPGFSAIGQEEAKAFFSRLRIGETGPPFRMPGLEDLFIHDFMTIASDMEPGLGAELENALSEVWYQFREEYARVSIQDLDGRFSRFIHIEVTPTSMPLS